MANTIRLRRGLEADRTTITPAEGEMIYTTDTNSLYIGDGSTAGGVKFDFNLDDIDVDTITANQLDINGTVTADGLTVDGDISVSDISPSIALMETDVIDKNTFLSTSVGNFNISTRSDAGSNTHTRFKLDHSTGDISFYEDTGTTPKFFWDASAESLGIGTDSPSAVLEVNTPSPVIRSTHSFSGDYLQLFHNGSGAYIDFSADDLIIRGASSAERMRIDSSGNLDMTGGGSIYADVGGIYLGGTGAANKLDDYEEGTWTPTITGSSSNPTVTYASNTEGTYTKIGNVVMVKCDINIDAISGGSGDICIDGQPFSSSGFPGWDSANFRDADAIKIDGQKYRLTGWFGNGRFYLTYVGSNTGHCGDASLSLTSLGTGRIQFTSWFTVA